MATATQPISQSLFDFLDGKNAFEKLEAIRSGELGREINRYVQDQLDRFHIGSIQDSIPGSPWNSAYWPSNGPIDGPAAPIAFSIRSDSESRFDLAGPEATRITASADLPGTFGSMDDALTLTPPSNPTDQIFRSHRS
jgi:hypothetical protein